MKCSICGKNLDEDFEEHKTDDNSDVIVCEECEEKFAKSVKKSLRRV